MIQIVQVEGVNSLAEYEKKSATIEVERPVVCLSDNCGRYNGFWKHTGYDRTALDGESRFVVRIQRFLCKYCGTVVSCLFHFLIPYVVFTAKAVGDATQAYSSRDISYRKLSEEQGALKASSGSDEDVLRPSHSQIYWWVKHVAFQSNVLLTGIQRFAVRTDAQLVGIESLRCPNRLRAFTQKKRLALDNLLRLMAQGSAICGSGELTASEWLHCYFLQTAPICTAIFSGRKLGLSAQQRMQHMNF
jgi:hypothetical protein